MFDFWSNIYYLYSAEISKNSASISVDFLYMFGGDGSVPGTWGRVKGTWCRVKGTWGRVKGTVGHGKRDSGANFFSMRLFGHQFLTNGDPKWV